MFEDELEFDKKKLQMAAALTTLLDIGYKRRNAWEKKSDLEQRIIEIALIKRDERFRESFRNLSMPSLLAYFLSDELNKLLVWEGRQSHFKLFQTLFERIHTNPNDLEFIRKTLYALTMELKLIVPMQYFNSLIAVVKLIYKTYPPIKMTIDSNFSENMQDFKVRQAALLLEHIGKKNFTALYPALWQLQNELVNEGLIFSERGHRLFDLGSAFTITQILTENTLEEMISWYIADKLNAYHKSFCGSKEACDEKVLKKLHAEDYARFFNIARRHRESGFKVDIYREMAENLESLKAERGFSNSDMFIWLWGMYHVISSFKHYHPQLGKEPVNAIRVLLLGDSISAGLRIPDLKKQARWVGAFANLLTESALPFQCQVVNCSVGGYKTEDGRRQTDRGMTVVEQELEAFKPDVVVITWGGNDAYVHAATRHIQKNIEDIIHLCKKRAKHIIWGCGIPETFECDAGYREDFTEMLKDVAEREKIAVVELPKEITKKENMAGDGIHFKEGPVLKKLAEFSYSVVHPLVAEVAKERRQQSTFLPYYQSERESKEQKDCRVPSPRQSAQPSTF